MKKDKKFDVVVLGGGPGGYPAAIRAAQMGKSVALVEAKQLGGTCLNRGCIPSKTLIASADTLKRVKEAEEFGIVTGSISFDFGKMVERKDRIVTKVRNSLEGLVASNNITLFKGYGKLTSPTSIKVMGEDNIEIKADRIIIATGSEPRNMPAFPFDHERIHDSTSMLEIRELPKKLVIIGGGIIGCEFASLYVALDVEIVILEALPSILPMEGANVTNTLTKAFKKKGIQIETNTLVEGIDRTKNGVRVRVAGGKVYEADIALVAVGRTLNTSNIGLEKAGVLVQDNGIIPVNNHMETNVPGIYAIGDIASKWWLAHVASHQGLVAASNACGVSAQMHYNAIPIVIFTDPEIGSVGYSLEEAIVNGLPATIGAFPFQALGKSQASFQTEGFAQIVINKETGQLLGAQVVGHEAATLVAEMGVAIANELTTESITATIHAHPTIAEVWLEAALIASEFPLHLPPQKRKVRSLSNARN